MGVKILYLLTVGFNYFYLEKGYGADEHINNIKQIVSHRVFDSCGTTFVMFLNMSLTSLFLTKMYYAQIHLTYAAFGLNFI